MVGSLLFRFGLTETFTGVGCVLNVGISQSRSVRESGDKKPFPIQIKRKLSPSSQFGTSKKMRRIAITTFGDFLYLETTSSNNQQHNASTQNDNLP